MALVPEVWTSIRRQVRALGTSLVDESAALLAVCERERTGPHAVVLFASRLQSDGLNPDLVSRTGDILVGFIADCETELQLQIADKHRYGVDLTPNVFSYAIDDLHCIPLLNLAFHEVSVRATRGSKDNVRAVFAFLSRGDRRELCEKGCTSGLIQRFPSYMTTYKGGMVDEPGEEDTVGRFEIPALRCGY